MLGKSARVRSAAEFDAIFASKLVCHGAVLSVRYVTSPGPARFGFLVGKRISPLATRRNLVKRRLRAAVRELYPNVKSDMMVVVLVRPGAGQRSYAELRDELRELLTKANLITTR